MCCQFSSFFIFRTNVPRNVFILILAIAAQVGVAEKMTTMHDSFMYCPQMDRDMIMHVSNKCDLLGKTKSQFVKPGEVLRNIIALAKLVDAVNGIGYECYQQDLTLTSWKTFFGMEHSDTRKHTIRLSRAECELMVKTKKCGDHEMICQETDCVYEPSLKPAFEWLSQSITNAKSCRLTKRKIVAKGGESVVFEQCKATELSCRLQSEAIVIWNKDIIHQCPFQRVAFLDSLQGFENEILYDENTRHVFKVTNVSNVCNMSLLETEQGLYLSTSRVAAFYTNSQLELTAVHELMLSEADGETFLSHREFAAIHKQMCRENYDRLHALSRQENVYMQFVDHQGNRRIVYASKGAIFLPRCVLVRYVNFTSSGFERKGAGLCGVNPLVEFLVDSTKGSGYLRQDGLISNTNQFLPCTEPAAQAVRYFSQHKKYYRISPMRVEEIINEVITAEELHANMREINFPHYGLILQEIDIYRELQKALMPTNQQQIIMVEEDELAENKNTSSTVTHIFDGFALFDTKSFALNALMVLMKLIALAIVSKLLYDWMKSKITARNRSAAPQNQDNTVSIHTLHRLLSRNDNVVLT